MNSPMQQRQIRGVSLIELMVGMTIGLLATLVITQVALNFEGQKRTTTSGSDAQVNGALALQTLQSSIESSGYGITAAGITSCTEIRGRRVGSTTTRIWTMAPAVINDGVAGAPDTIRILTSSKGNFALPMRVWDKHARGETRFGLDANINFGNAVGDLMLAVPPGGSTNSCSLFSISKIPTTTKTINGVPTPVVDRFIEHTAGADPSQAWNQDPLDTVFPGNVGTDISYPDGSYLVNLGSLIDRTYKISPQQSLVEVTYSTATGTETETELFPNIVSLQAVYGIDTSVPRDKVVDAWSLVMPATGLPPSTADDWSRVIALRIAVVARSAQPEKKDVSTAPPVWRGAGLVPETIPVTDNGTGPYRYKVFETVVPLRNLLWQS